MDGHGESREREGGGWGEQDESTPKREHEQGRHRHPTDVQTFLNETNNDSGTIQVGEGVGKRNGRNNQYDQLFIRT